MIPTADRLLTIDEYYFSKKLKEVNLLKTQGKPIINLAIGSPDLQPPQEVVTALTQSLSHTNAHKYQPYQGRLELREAMAKFYKTKFGVSLNPETEILPLMGSKEGVMHISMTYLNQGDEVLIPNPGYPTYTAISKLVGATPRYYNLDKHNNWLPNLKRLEATDLSKVKLMWVNYPHMPTGATATQQFFETLIAFAKQYGILIVNDNPYGLILNNSPLSILKVRGAKELCLELNSLSKTFNMAGWRVGMLLGNQDYIANILNVKSNIDSGMFYSIQEGAIKALECSSQWYLNLNDIYKQRKQLVWQLLDTLKCTYNTNTVGLFVWAKLPNAMESSKKFVNTILRDYNIFIAPGEIFGTNGEGYIRVSLCASTEDIKAAILRITKKE